MSHLNKTEDFQSEFSGSVPRGRPESLDLISLDTDPECEMRFFENFFFINQHQEMPATQKIADVKQILGYGPKTHYRTMLKIPTNKLRPFVYPNMTVDQLKTLVTDLRTADPAKKAFLRRNAMNKTKQADKLAAQKKKLFADLARATRAKIRKNPPQIVESYKKRITKKKTPWPSAVKDAYFITKSQEPLFGELRTSHPGIENRNGRLEIQDASPEQVILPILKRYPGQTIRLVLMTTTGGQINEDGNLLTNRNMAALNFPKGIHYETEGIYAEEDTQGEFVGYVDYGERIGGIMHYNVPVGNAKINNFFKDDGVYYDWQIASPRLVSSGYPATAESKATRKQTKQPTLLELSKARSAPPSTEASFL